MSTFGTGSFGSGTFGNPTGAVHLAGSVSIDVQASGALASPPVHLAGTLSTDVQARGEIRFSKYLAGRSSTDLGVFGLVRVTPDPLRGRINLATAVAGRLAVRVAVAGRVGAPIGVRGDLRVPTTLRLYSRPPQVRVDPFGRLAVSAPPPNDLFANALVITGGEGTLTGTNVGATREVGEPAGASTVWWRWTAPYSGEATFGVLDADFFSFAEVFTGTSVGALTLVGRDSEPFPIRRGSVYHIRLRGGSDTAQGTATISWSSIATELASWSRDESQRFRIDVALIGALRLDIPPVPVPARFGGEVGVRTHRTWVVMPDPVIGPNGFPV